MEFTQKILADPINKWVFDHSPEETYLVGGYIRDILRGEMPEDKDFVLKRDAEKTAKKAARIFGGKFIDLHNKQTFRVALKGGRFIDFSPLNNTIMEDLQSRDFTMNAIAWSPASGFMSPDNYKDDIEKKVVRHIKPQNLLNDPLRILRAYRLAAQLDFEILNDTRELLKKYSKTINSAAPERTTEELFKLLNCNNVLNYLELCLKDNVLSSLLQLTNYNNAINLISIEAFEDLQQQYLSSHQIKTYLSDEFSQGLNKYAFIRLYLLLRKYDKNANRICDKETVSDLPHKKGMLRLSTRIRKSLYAIEKAESMFSGRMTDGRLYQIFKNAGDCIYEITILLSITKPARYRRIMKKAEEFLYSRNNTLLNGTDIKKLLGIESGRVIGAIKERVLENQFRGNIRNRRDAREFIMRNFT